MDGTIASDDFSAIGSCSNICTQDGNTVNLIGIHDTCSSWLCSVACTCPSGYYVIRGLVHRDSTTACTVQAALATLVDSAPTALNTTGQDDTGACCRAICASP